jgi:cytosine/adenosine deaminase-related metal-dependent hydrolase
MPTNVQLYAGTERPIIERYEALPLVWKRKQWNRDSDGSLYRGYHNEATNQFVGSRYSIGVTTQAAYDAAHTEAAAAAAARQENLDRCQVLFGIAKAHAETPGTNPALTTRQLNESIARIFRLLHQLFEDQA